MHFVKSHEKITPKKTGDYNQTKIAGSERLIPKLQAPTGQEIRQVQRQKRVNALGNARDNASSGMILVAFPHSPEYIVRTKTAQFQ
jgi:hypothetical protein